MPTNPPLGFDSNEYTSEGEFYRSNSPEQLRLDEKRNFAFGGGLLKGITELPLDILEFMSPADEYVPGALAPDQSSPRQRIRTERLHGEQFYDELKADPDTAQAAEVGYGTSFVVDPIIDTGIGLAPHLVKGMKAIARGDNFIHKLPKLRTDEKGMIVGRHGLDELGIDPETDLVGQYSGIWDRAVRAELDDSGAILNPDVDVTNGWGIANDAAYATRAERKAEAESLLADGWEEKKIYKLTGMVDQGDGFVDFLSPPSKRPYINEALAKSDPTLAEGIRIRMQGEQDNIGGYYNNEQDEISAFTLGEGGVKNPQSKEVIHHELQHAIQGREGFARGGSPEEFQAVKDRAMARVSSINKDLSEIAPQLDKSTGKQKQQLQEQFDAGMNEKKSLINDFQLDPYDSYKRLAGEWEARNTGKRATLSPDDERLGEVVEKLGVKFRSGKPFSTADDIALNDLIVKMDGGTASSIEKVPSYGQNGQEFNVVTNPTQSQLKGLLNKARKAKDSRRGGGGDLRYSYDMDGNLYAWDAWEGQHNDVSKHFGFEASDIGRIERDTQIPHYKAKGAVAASQPIPVDLSKQSLSEVFSEARAGRMERATEQGFDIEDPLYHGSGDISDFTSFDPAKTGKGADQYGSGFYLTTSPHEASGYASDVARGQGKFKTKNPGVVPVYSNMKKYIEVDPKTQNNLGDVIDLDSSQVRKMLDKSDALKRGIDDEDMNPAGDHFESFWNDGPEDWMLDDLAETYAHGTPESIEVDLFDGDSDAFRRALGEVTGMEGLRVNHGDGLSHVIPWFPENIRSVNAQFDPAKSKSGELLATAAGASVALSAANREPQPVDMSKTTLREVLGR